MEEKMGRVYHTVTSNNKSLNTLFDAGAIHNYITEKASQGFATVSLRQPFDVALGGKGRKISKASLIEGYIEGKHFYFWANVIEDIGNDEKGREIDVIWGAVEMQRWNIRVDPKEEKLDLSGFRRIH